MAAARPVGSRGWRPRIGAAAHLIRVARVELDDAVPPHPTLRWLQSGCAAARTPAASAASAAGAAATLGGAGVDLHLLRPLQAGSKERRTVSDFLEVAVSARLDLHALHHLLVHLLLALGDLRPGGQRNTISRRHCRRQSRLKLSAHTCSSLSHLSISSSEGIGDLPGDPPPTMTVFGLAQLGMAMLCRAPASGLGPKQVQTIVGKCKLFCVYLKVAPKCRTGWPYPETIR